MPKAIENSKQNKKGTHLKWALIIICSVCLTSVVTIWLAEHYIFPKKFKPVQLDAQEERILETKIKALTADTPYTTNKSGERQLQTQPTNKPERKTLEPERYSERNAKREIHLTERELNGLLTKNTDLAQKLVIDLSDNLASAKLLVPLDPELPFFGGKTLKVTAGMELRYSSQPVAILKGVSIWGVPIPNAWLGGIKNIDLFREFGMDQSIWQTIAAGVEDIHIDQEKLTIKLKP